MHTQDKTTISKQDAINIVIHLAQKQISQEKDWQSYYPYMPLTNEQQEQLNKAEQAIRIISDLIE